MITIGSIAVLLYVAAWLALANRWRAKLSHSNAPTMSQYYLILWAGAALFHASYLYLPLIYQQQIALDFMSAASHIMWLAGFILLLSSVKQNVESLNVFTLPFIGLALALQLLMTKDSSALALNGGVGIHIFSALLAYSMLMIAAIQSLILAYQHTQLHARQTNAFLQTLPPLQVMDSLLFRFLATGLILLSIALVTGFIYLENLFGQHIGHKTILSIIAWFVFSALLIGRWRYGWRGLSAARWTLSGFGLLMLAFFGTKFVQEYLLAS
ncbi:MAG: cytochrome C assembly family protein [Leucothrix sp.]